MTALAHPETALGHPAAVVAGVHAALDSLRDVELRDEEYAEVIAECSRARSRLRAVELGLVAAAEGERSAAVRGAQRRLLAGREDPLGAGAGGARRQAGGRPRQPAARDCCRAVDR